MRVTIDLGDIQEECFVLIPFTPKFDLLFEEVLDPAIEDAGLAPVRADNIYGSRRIMQDIWDRIRGARLVVGELTGRNANVLYELGLAHALGKPAVIITNTMDDVPFDLKDVRCLVYDKDHPRWGEVLRRGVARTIRSVLEQEATEALLSNIESDVEYQPVAEASAQASRTVRKSNGKILEVAGEWELIEVLTYEHGEVEERKTTMTLTQEEEVISGFAVTTGDETEVIQEVSGYVRGNRVDIVASSYEILSRPAERPTIGWFLDSWSGEVEDGNRISGSIEGTNATGRFSGHKS